MESTRNPGQYLLKGSPGKTKLETLFDAALNQVDDQKNEQTIKPPKKVTKRKKQDKEHLSVTPKKKRKK